MRNFIHLLLMCIIAQSVYAAQAPTLTQFTYPSPLTYPLIISEDTWSNGSDTFLRGMGDENAPGNRTAYFEISRPCPGSQLLYGPNSTGDFIAVPDAGIVLTGSLNYNWIPPANASGTFDAFFVRAYDGSQYSATFVPFRITVTPVNDAPVAKSLATSTLSLSTNEDVPVSARLNITDIDSDYSALQVSFVSDKPSMLDAPGMVLSGVNGDNVATFTPNANQNGTVNVTMTIMDSAGASLVLRIALTISPVNDAPTMTSISPFNGIEDQMYTVQLGHILSASDAKDIDGNQLNLRITRNADGGIVRIRHTDPAYYPTIVLAPGQTYFITNISNNYSIYAYIECTPPADWNGPWQPFTAVAHDGFTPSLNEVPVTLMLASVNDAPTLSSISPLAGAAEDTGFTISYQALSGAANEVDVDSSVQFRLEALSAGTLMVRAAGSTVAPVAAVPGTTVLTAATEWIWWPASNFNGTQNAFTVRAFDGSLTSATPVAVPIQVAPVNDAPGISGPVAPITIVEDSAGYSFNVSVSDLETPVDQLVVTCVSLPSNVFIPTITGTGSLRTIALKPASNYCTAIGTAPAVITYRVTDNGDGTAAARTFPSTGPGQFAITVTPVDDLPTLSTVTTLTGATEDTTKIISYDEMLAAANEADVDADPSRVFQFRVESVTLGSLGIRAKGSTVAPVAIVAQSSLLSPTTELVWTPPANRNGILSAFSIRAVCVEMIPTARTTISTTVVPVSINVAPINDLPMISGTTSVTIAEDTSHTFTVTVSDVETPADQLVVTAHCLNYSSEWSATITGTGSVRTITLRPALNFNSGYFSGNGPSFIHYNVRDSGDGTAPIMWSTGLTDSPYSRFSIEVSSVDDLPNFTAIGPVTGCMEDVPIIISYSGFANTGTLGNAVSATDVDANANRSANKLMFRIEAVAEGTLGIRTAGSTASPTPVVLQSTLLEAGKELVWTPPLHVSGTRSAFTVRAISYETFSTSPPITTLSATAAVVSVVVAPVNDAPTFVRGADITVASSSGLQTRLGWATSISKGPADEASQVVTFTCSGYDATMFSVPPAVSATGTLTFTPASGAAGATTVTVVLRDNGGTLNGGKDSSTQTFTIVLTLPSASG